MKRIIILGLILLSFLLSCDLIDLLDRLATSEVQNLTASAGEQEVILTWTNPPDPDFDHIEIWYGVGAADIQFTGLIDPVKTTINNLENNIAYLFLVKTVDFTGNVSNGCSILATPVPLDVTVPDTTAPVITLEGSSAIELDKGSTYADPGYSASDNVDGDITSRVVVSGEVFVNEIGSYSITYNVTDSAGNNAVAVIRTITVVENIIPVPDTTAPVITLEGSSAIELDKGSTYADPGYSASDNVDGDITSRVVVSGEVNVEEIGTYVIAYNVVDSAGNNAVEVIRTITVVENIIPIPDTTAPVITLEGSSAIELDKGSTYTDPGYSASDNVDGDITSRVVVSGEINVNEIGAYSITYNVTDSAGNNAVAVIRVVRVLENVPPVANAGNDKQSRKGLVYLDGTGSYDTKDTLTYHWECVNPIKDMFIEYSDRSEAIGVLRVKPGEYSFRLTVSDGVSEDSDTIVVTVANEAPRIIEIVALSGLSSSSVGAEVELTKYVEEYNSDSCTYFWEILDQPIDSTLIVQNPGFEDFSFTPVVAGQYIFKLTVDDGEFNTAKEFSYLVFDGDQGGINVSIE